jgi:Uma2 family endonuclease
MLSVLETPAVRQRVLPISVKTYHAMAEHGLVAQNAELIRGVIVEKMPKSPLHTALTDALCETFRTAVQDYWVRMEQPLTLADSEPEPDIAVVPGNRADYTGRHPDTAALVVEISISTEEMDREKGAVYAEAGVQEYWLVLAERRVVEVYARPVGGAWTSVRTYADGETITSSALPIVSVKLADFYPSQS